MTHPLVLQLRFTRNEFRRGLEGVSDDEARRRFMPMNCIAWNVGHLAWQEQRYWLYRGQGRLLLPEINQLFAYGAPASTPALSEMLVAWEAITREADPWLDTLTSEILSQTIEIKGWSNTLSFGSLLLRTIYHYWYHTGEIMATRQLLGHTGLPEFVGDIDNQAPYEPE